jgi:hypothetical protein
MFTMLQSSQPDPKRGVVLNTFSDTTWKHARIESRKKMAITLGNMKNSTWAQKVDRWGSRVIVSTCHAARQNLLDGNLV